MRQAEEIQADLERTNAVIERLRGQVRDADRQMSRALVLAVGAWMAFVLVSVLVLVAK